MEDDNIKKLLEQLGSIGICPTGQRYLNGTKKDFHTLVKVWRGWPEYLYEHSGVALKFLRNLLTPADMQRLANESLFVDFKGEKMLNNTHPVFVMGNSDVTFTMNSYAVIQAYLFNGAKATFNMSKNVILTVEAFDDTRVAINHTELGKCTVYQYDHAAVQGNAAIVKKQYVRGKVFNGQEIS